MRTLGFSAAILVLAGWASSAAVADNCEEFQPGAGRLDASPRRWPNGLVNVGDVIVALRLAAAVESPTPYELQRLDVGPSPALCCVDSPTVHRVQPDGRLDVADVVLTLRVAVGASVLSESGTTELLFVEPEGACALEGQQLRLVGRELAPGGHLPTVEVAGAPAEVLGRRSVLVGGEEMDSVAVRLLEPLDPPPPPSGELVAVRVDTPLGEAELAGAVRLAPGCASAPVLVVVEPSEAVLGQEPEIHLTGLRLACVRSVSFVHVDTEGRSPAELLFVASDNEIVVSAPEGLTEGLHDLEVESPCGLGSLPAAFLAQAPEPGGGSEAVPGLERIEPTWAREHLSIPVTLRGHGLEDVDEIRWDDTLLHEPDFRHEPDGSLFIPGIPLLSFDPPPHARQVEVSVSAAGTVLEATGAFSYQASCDPACGSLSPAAGPIGGGNAVTITPPWEADLAGVDAVRFGGRVASAPELVEGFQLRVVAPAAAGTGAVPVELVSDGSVVATCESLYDYR